MPLTKSFLSLILAGGYLFCIVSPLTAEEEKKEEPRLGNIAGSGSSNTGGSSSYVGGDVLGDGTKPNPITGSVSRKGKVCILKVFNNSEDGYSASVVAKGLGKNGNVVTSRSFSFTLGAKQGSERELQVSDNVSSCSLDLSSVRNLSPKKPDAKPDSKGSAAEPKPASVGGVTMGGMDG